MCRTSLTIPSIAKAPFRTTYTRRWVRPVSNMTDATAPQRRMNNPVIFVCDIQERFRDAIYEFDKVIKTTQKVLRAAHALQIPIHATTQNAARLGPTVPELTPYLTSSPPVDKTLFSMLPIPPTTSPSSPSSPNHLSLTLTRPSQIALLGIESHICITQTALDAARAGHAVYVLADGVSSCNREEVTLALARLRGVQGVTVTTSEAWLYECLGDAGLPGFRELVGIVKEAAGDTRAALRALVPAPGGGGGG